MRKKKSDNIGKEIIIFLLLIILIMLVLAVVLYDLVPSNITIPEAIEYTSDSKTTSIKQEIAYTNGGDLTADESTSKTGLDEVATLKTYNIDASDLNMYRQKNLYISGNSNPFDYAEDTTENGEANTSGNGANQTDTATAAQTTNAQSSNSTPGTIIEKPNSK